MRDTRYEMRDTRYEMRDTRYKIRILLVCLCFVTGPAVASVQSGATALEPPRRAEAAQDTNAPGRQVSADSNALARELWQARIATPVKPKDDKSVAELMRLIKLVGSIRFEHQQGASKGELVSEPAGPTEPNKTVSIAAPNKPGHREIKIEPAPQKLSDRTLAVVKGLLNHPEQAADPLGLAEVLFLSGHTKPAVVFYREALNHTSANDPRSVEDRAWILFQIANCLREDDPAEARKMYGELIGQYPKCPWVDAAKARDKLVEWYELDKPWALLGDSIEQGTKMSVSKAGPRRK